MEVMSTIWGEMPCISQSPYELLPGVMLYWSKNAVSLWHEGQVLWPTVDGKSRDEREQLPNHIEAIGVNPSQADRGSSQMMPSRWFFLHCGLYIMAYEVGPSMEREYECKLHGVQPLKGGAISTR